MKVKDPEILKKQIALQDKEISKLKDEITELSRELVKALKTVMHKDEYLRTMEKRVEEIMKKHEIEVEEGD